MPLLAYIFDAKYNAKYGTVYAIAQAAVSLAYFVGELGVFFWMKLKQIKWLIKSNLNSPFQLLIKYQKDNLKDDVLNMVSCYWRPLSSTFHSVARCLYH